MSNLHKAYVYWREVTHHVAQEIRRLYGTEGRADSDTILAQLETLPQFRALDTSELVCCIEDAMVLIGWSVA